MVSIRIKDDYIENNPRIKSLGQAFILHLGDDDFVIPSPSRSLNTIDEAVRNGSPYQMNIRPGAVFHIDNSVFQNLVNSSKAGGDTSLINRLLHFVDAEVIEVSSDEFANVMSSTEILAYEAP